MTEKNLPGEGTARRRTHIEPDAPATAVPMVVPSRLPRRTMDDTAATDNTRTGHPAALAVTARPRPAWLIPTITGILGIILGIILGVILGSMLTA